MARRPRYYVTGMPYHIVQRGNNRSLCFYETADQGHYLELLAKISERYGVAVHAYCLMSNHVHILVTCGHVDSISWMMRVVGSSYAQYINKKYERTGTLWEGRHRSSMIQSTRHLLNCYRYIELNPVRANMVSHPADYPWSSYAFNAKGEPSWLTEHAEYTALGSSKAGRLAAYRQLFSTPLDDEEIEFFRASARSCTPVGDDEFIASWGMRGDGVGGVARRRRWGSRWGRRDHFLISPSPTTSPTPPPRNASVPNTQNLDSGETFGRFWSLNARTPLLDQRFRATNH